MNNVYAQYRLNGEARLCRKLDNLRDWASQYPNAYGKVEGAGAGVVDYAMRIPAAVGHVTRFVDAGIRDLLGVEAEPVNPNSMLPYTMRGVKTALNGVFSLKPGMVLSGAWDAVGNVIPDALDTVSGVKHTP